MSEQLEDEAEAIVEKHDLRTRRLPARQRNALLREATDPESGTYM